MSPEVTPQIDHAADLERKLRWSVEGAKPKAPGVLREFVPEVPAQYRQLGRPARLWQKAVFGRERAVALGGAALMIALVAGLAFVATRPAAQPAGSQASEIAVATGTASAFATEYATPGQTPDGWSTSDGSPSPTMSRTPRPRPSLPATACASAYKPPASTPTPTATPVPIPTATATATPTELATYEPSDSAAPTAEVLAPSPAGDAGVAGPALPAAAPLVYGAAPPSSWTWQQVGSVVVVGRIVATPAGFLATLEIRKGGTLDYDVLGYAMCTSPDLVHWYPPTNPKVFVNETGGYFYPYEQIRVGTGYAARSNDPYVDDYDSSGHNVDPGTRWYSSDGVHWQEGIPDGVTVLEPPCYDDYSAPPPSQCVTAMSTRGWELSMYNLGGVLMVSRDAGATWKEAKLPANVDSGFRDVEALSGGLFAGVTYESGPPPPPGPGVLAMGNDYPVLLVSSDGVKWREVANMAGEHIVAYGSALLVDRGTSIWQSTDKCKTWVEIKDQWGQPVGGGVNGGGVEMDVVGKKIVLYDADDSSTILWVGTPK